MLDHNAHNLSKLECARRQLREGIKLYFQKRDAVSICTLVAAAHQILHDLTKHQPGIDSIKNSPLISETLRADRKAAINAAPNFFKHADRDHDATFTLNSLQIEMLLLDGILLFEALSRTTFPDGRVLLGYLFLKHPTWLRADAPEYEELTSLTKTFGNADADVATLCLSRLAS
jgi:hypothetical protein